MSCRELIDFLDRYVEGELPPEQTRRFDHHLSLCPDCVDYLHGYRQTIRLAGEAWREEDALAGAPPALIDAILASRTGAAAGESEA